VEEGRFSLRDIMPHGITDGVIVSGHEYPCLLKSACPGRLADAKSLFPPKLTVSFSKGNP
jgi:hypothetical protein